MTQAQIELLITARINAQSALDSLGKQIDGIKKSGDAAAGASKSAASEFGGFGEKAKKVVGDLTESAGSVVAFAAAVGGATGLVEAGLDAAKEAGREAIAFAKESISVFREDESVRNQLSAAIALQGRAVEQVLPKYQALAEATSDNTLFSKQDALRAITYFQTVGQLGPAQTGLAVQAATKLATVLGTDLGQASKDLVRYLDGDGQALRRLGLNLDTTVVKTQGVSAGLEYIIARLQGLPEAAAAGSKGAEAVFDNAIEDLKSATGSFLTVVLDPVERAVGGQIKQGAKDLETIRKFIDDELGRVAKRGFGAEAQAEALTILGTALLANRFPAGPGNMGDVAAEDLRKRDEQMQVASLALTSSLENQIQTEGAAILSMRGLADGTHSAAEMMGVGGQAAQGFLQHLSMLSAMGIPLGNLFGKQMPEDIKRVAQVITDAQARIARQQVDAQTAGLRQQMGLSGIDLTVAKIDQQKRADIAAQELQLRTKQVSEDEIGRMRASRTAYWDQQIANARVEDQKAIDKKLADIAFEGTRALIMAGPSGAQTQLAALTAQFEKTKADNLRGLKEGTQAYQEALQLNAAAEATYWKNHNAILTKENREAIDAVRQMDSEATQESIASTQLGLLAKLSAISQAEQAQIAALKRAGDTEDAYQIKLVGITAAAASRRRSLLAEADRDQSTDSFAIDQEIVQARINLSGRALTVAIANLEIEHEARAREKELELAFYQVQLRQLQILYAEYVRLGDARAAAVAGDMDALKKLIANDEEWLTKLDLLFGLKEQKLMSASAQLLGINSNVETIGRSLADAGDLFDSHFLKHVGEALNKFERMVSIVHDLTSSIRNITDILNVGGGGRGGGGAGNLASDIGGSVAKKFLGKALGFGGAAAGAGATAGLGGTSVLTMGADGLFSVGGTTAGVGLSAAAIGATAGIAAGVIGAYYLGKHLWGDAGRDAVENFGNKNSWPGFGKGLDHMHSLMAVKFGPRATNELWSEMQGLGKKDVDGARRWEDEVIAAFAQVGIGGLQKFTEGGYAAGPTLALVGDSPGGEYMIPGKKMDAIASMLSGMHGGDTHHHWNATVSAHDADSLTRMMRAKGGRAFIKWIQDSGEARLALNTALGNRN